MLYSTGSKQNTDNSAEHSPPTTVICGKCNTRNNLTSNYCATCGEKIQFTNQVMNSNNVPNQRDTEELAKRLKKPDTVFDVKYLAH